MQSLPPNVAGGVVYQPAGPTQLPRDLQPVGVGGGVPHAHGVHEPARQAGARGLPGAPCLCHRSAAVQPANHMSVGDGGRCVDGSHGAFRKYSEIIDGLNSFFPLLNLHSVPQNDKAYLLKRKN